MKKKDIILATALHVIGMMTTLLGMAAMFYSWNPSWWPVYFNTPGIWLIWLGVIINTLTFCGMLLSVKEV